MGYESASCSHGLSMSIDTFFGQISIKVAGSEKEEIDANAIDLLRVAIDRMNIDHESLNYN